MRMEPSHPKKSKDKASTLSYADNNVVQEKFRSLLEHENSDDLSSLKSDFKSLQFESEEGDIAYELVKEQLSSPSIEYIEFDSKFSDTIAKNARKLESRGTRDKKITQMFPALAIIASLLILFLGNKAFLGTAQEVVTKFIQNNYFLELNQTHFTIFAYFVFFLTLVWACYLFINSRWGISDTDHSENIISLLNEINQGCKFSDSEYLNKSRAFEYFSYLKYINRKCSKKGGNKVIVFRNLPESELTYLLQLIDKYSYNITLIHFLDINDKGDVGRSNSLVQPVEKMKIRPISRKLLSKFWQEFGVGENTAEKLSLIMAPNYEAICYVASQILKNGECIDYLDINNLESYCNPALNWQKNWNSVKDDDRKRTILDLRMLVSLIGSCTFEELSSFSSAVLQQPLSDKWKSELLDCAYIFDNGGRFRSLSFSRSLFYSVYDDNKERYENYVRFDRFRSHALERRWLTYIDSVSVIDSNSKTSNSNFDYLLEVFAPRILTTLNRIEVRDSIVGVLSPANCFDEVMKYLARDENFSKVRNSYLRGLRHASYGVVQAVQYLKEISCDPDFIVANYPSWLVLKADMLRGVGIGLTSDALKCAHIALEEFKKRQTSKELNHREQVYFFNILYFIASSYQTKVFNAQVLGLIEYGIEELRELYTSEIDIEIADRRELEALYIKYVLLTRKRVHRNRTFKHHEAAIDDILGHKFENVVEDYQDLYHSLPRLELCTRYCSLKLDKADLFDRLSALEKVIPQLRDISEDNPKSGEAMSLFLSGIKGKAYILSKLGDEYKTQTNANILLNEIRDYLDKYKQRRSHIGEHTTIKPSFVITLLDRLKDAVLVGVEFDPELLDRDILVSVFQYLNSEADRHIADERYSPLDVNEIDESRVVIEEFLAGYDCESQIDSSFLSSAQVSKLQDLSNSLLMAISRHKYNNDGENTSQRSALNEFYQINQMLWITKPTTYEFIFAQALAMKVSNGSYAYPSFKNNIARIKPEPSRKGLNLIMDIVYKSVALYSTYETVEPNLILPCRVLKWSKFGVVCATQQDMHKNSNRLYVPRVVLENSYNDCERDFCSPNISKLLGIKPYNEVKDHLPKYVFVQSMGKKVGEKRPLSKTMFDTMQVVRELDNTKLRAFSKFIENSDSIGTMRGDTFFQSVLNNFFISFHTPNFQFDDKNTFLAMNKSWALLLVPSRCIDYYLNSMIRRQIYYMTGIYNITILPEGLSAEDIACQLTELFRVPAIYDAKTNTLKCYTEPRKNKSLLFLLNTMKSKFDTQYMVEKEIWNELQELA
ncbi:hypothetical protein ACT31I_003501 [Vibrio cidicii]|nr:hypothetical protein [Vibrio cidicii]